jgi:ribonuclease D
MNVSYYLDSLNKTIQTQVDLLNAYKKRIEINKFKQLHLESSLNDEELNEVTISTLKTMAEIETLENIIKEKKNYFENYSKFFETQLNETNEGWDSLISKARLELPKKPQLKTFIDAIDGLEDINSDLDKKVFIYKRLKPLING